MPPRSHCQGPGVLGLSFVVSSFPVPCVGPRSFPPMSFSSLVQSRCSSHTFCVGSSDIYFPCSICGVTSLSVPCRKFPWVRILLRKHRAASYMDAFWTHCSIMFAAGGVLWWIALPAVDFACDPSEFLLILGSACGHFSL